MNLYVSRSGQTFGPYTIQQAKVFLDSNQLLPTDFALIEGSAEWKSLPDLLAENLSNLTNPSLTEEKLPELPAQNCQTEASTETKAKTGIPKHGNKTGAKVQKIARSRGDRIIMVAQEKSFISKIFSTIFVFTFLLLIAVGLIVGAYFLMPEQMSENLKRFGIVLDRNSSRDSITGEQVETKSAGEIMLSEDAWNTLRSSGIRILPIIGAKGLQVISSVDPELAMKDEDLEKLMIIAPHIISLDLTDSKVTNEGFQFISKMPNLRKLFLEGVQGIDSSGISHLKNSTTLEYLNLIRVNLDAAAVDILISLEALREVYLFDTGLDESGIQKLKKARPKVFVNSG